MKMATLAKLLVALGLDASEYDEGLDKAKDKADGFGNKLGGFLGSAMKLGLAATAGGVVAALGGIVKGVASNAEFERYQTQFSVLLGSTEKAKARLQDLADFGQKTPFELPEVVQADKILQGFGLHSEDAAKRFGFSGEQIRTIAGDVAAGTGSSFSEMSLLLGKFSAGATGEAISRMAELGIASRADLAAMGLEFDKSGALLSPLPEAMNVVLKLMKTKYGGMMDAQSQTFEGMISNLQDWVSGTLRTLSAPIFDVVKEKLGGLLTFLGSPDTQAMLNSFADNLSKGVGTAIDFISNNVIPAFTSAWTNLQPVLQFVGGLISQIVSTAVGIISSFTAAGASATGLRDVLVNIFGAELGGAIANFVDWLEVRVPQALTVAQTFAQNVLLPALGAVWGFLKTYVVPILMTVATWLLNNLPTAIDAIVAVINDPLIPAFTAVWAFLAVNVVPILTTLYNWLFTSLPAATNQTAGFINTTLIPAFNTIWSFLQTYVIPVLTFLTNVVIAGVKLEVSALAAFVTTILLPAFRSLWGFINSYIVPILKVVANIYIAAVSLAFRTIASIITTIVMPNLIKLWNYFNTYVNPILIFLYQEVLFQVRKALENVAFFILGTVLPQLANLVASINSHVKPALETAQHVLADVRTAFGDIDSAIQSTIRWLQSIADKLNSISVPDWLQGHSPPPMANWFSYIGKAAQDATNTIQLFGIAAQKHLPAIDQLNKAFNGGSNFDLNGPLRGGGNGGNNLQDRLRGLFGEHNNTSHNSNHISLTANYDFQSERSLRDDFRAATMLLGINPTG